MIRFKAIVWLAMFCLAAMVSHYYRRPALSPAGKNGLLSAVRQTVLPAIKDIETEYCFNVGTTDALSSEEQKVLQWLLAETFEPEHFSDKSFLGPASQDVIARSGTTKQSPFSSYLRLLRAYALAITLFGNFRKFCFFPRITIVSAEQRCYLR